MDKAPYSPSTPLAEAKSHTLIYQELVTRADKRRLYTQISREETANSPLGSEYFPRRHEMKLRKSQMKLRKNEVKVRRNLPFPPWRFLISSVESQNFPLPLLPYLLSFQKPSSFGKTNFQDWKVSFPPLETFFSSVGNVILTERAHDSFLRLL